MKQIHFEINEMINHPDVTFIKLDRRSFSLRLFSLMMVNYSHGSLPVCLFLLMRRSLKPPRRLFTRSMCDEHENEEHCSNRKTSSVRM